MGYLYEDVLIVAAQIESSINKLLNSLLMPCKIDLILRNKYLLPAVQILRAKKKKEKLIDEMKLTS